MPVELGAEQRAKAATPAAPNQGAARRAASRHGWFARTIPMTSRTLPMTTRWASVTPFDRLRPVDLGGELHQPWPHAVSVTAVGLARRLPQSPTNTPTASTGDPTGRRCDCVRPGAGTISGYQLEGHGRSRVPGQAAAAPGRDRGRRPFPPARGELGPGRAP